MKQWAVRLTCNSSRFSPVGLAVILAVLTTGCFKETGDVDSNSPESARAQVSHQRAKVHSKVFPPMESYEQKAGGLTPIRLPLPNPIPKLYEASEIRRLNLGQIEALKAARLAAGKNWDAESEAQLREAISEQGYHLLDAGDFLGVCQSNDTLWFGFRYLCSLQLVNNVSADGTIALNPRELWTVLLGINVATGRKEIELLDHQLMLGELPPVRAPMNYRGWELSFWVDNKWIFIADREHLVRMDRATRQRRTVPLPAPERPNLRWLGGRLVAGSSNYMASIDPDSLEIRLLASTRRKPPMHELDTVEAYSLPIAWNGSGNGAIRLCIETPRNLAVYEVSADGSSARKAMIIPDTRLDGGYITPGLEGALLHGGWHYRGRYVLRVGSASEPELLVLHPGRYSDQDAMLSATSDDIPRWILPKGHLATEGAFAETRDAFWSLSGMGLPGRDPSLAVLAQNRSGAVTYSFALPAVPAVDPQHNWFRLSWYGGIKGLLPTSQGLAIYRSDDFMISFIPFESVLPHLPALAAALPVESRPLLLSEQGQRLKAGARSVAESQKLGELTRSPAELKTIHKDSASLESLVKEIDKDGNSTIDGNEALYFDADHDHVMDAEEVQAVQRMALILARTMIKKADLNGDQRLSAVEIQRALSQWHSLPTDKKLNYPRYDQLSAVDVDGDQLVTADEVADWQAETAVAQITRMPRAPGLPPQIRRFDFNANGILEPEEQTAMQRTMQSPAR